jgi:hypothetical protein
VPGEEGKRWSHAQVVHKNDMKLLQRMEARCRRTTASRCRCASRTTRRRRRSCVRARPAAVRTRRARSGGAARADRQAGRSRLRSTGAGWSMKVGVWGTDRWMYAGNQPMEEYAGDGERRQVDVGIYRWICKEGMDLQKKGGVGYGVGAGLARGEGIGGRDFRWGGEERQLREVSTSQPTPAVWVWGLRRHFDCQTASGMILSRPASQRATFRRCPRWPLCVGGGRSAFLSAKTSSWRYAAAV